MKKRKPLLIALSAVLLIAITVAGTVAYLTETTGAVTNTFTVGKILEDGDKFVVAEHEAKQQDDGTYKLDTTSEKTANSYKVLPGVDLPKDPFARTDSTKKLQMDAYVFVEVVDTLGTNLHATVNTTNWTLLKDVTGPNGGKVYYLAANGGIAKKGSALAATPILAKNAAEKEITVDNAEITDAAAQFGGDIKFYGYMIQAGGFKDAADAWAKGFAPAETESESGATE